MIPFESKSIDLQNIENTKFCLEIGQNDVIVEHLNGYCSWQSVNNASFCATKKSATYLLKKPTVYTDHCHNDVWHNCVPISTSAEVVAHFDKNKSIKQELNIYFLSYGVKDIRPKQLRFNSIQSK